MMIAALERLYRRLFCFGGHGVHSPFVFNLITEVIEEKRAYYCYERLKNVRMQLLQTTSKIISNNHELTIRSALDKYCFTEHENRLLFRLANRFQPRTIYLTGSNLGLTPLYLTAYSKHTHCFVFEPEPSAEAIAQKIIDTYASARIDICDTLLQDLHTPNNQIDFIVLGRTCSDTSDNKRNSVEKLSVDFFRSFLPYLNDQSVMVISGINATHENYSVWKSVCCFPEVSVSLDLYSLGIVFFNPKLYRKTYKSFVP